MILRDYSNKKSASGIFFDLLDRVSRRGWFNAGPLQESEDDDFLLFVNFHVHPEDAEKLSKLFEKSLCTNDFWYLKVEQGNRFSLYSRALKRKATELSDFREAVNSIVCYDKELGRRTAEELKLLSDDIYKRFEENNEHRRDGD